MHWTVKGRRASPAIPVRKDHLDKTALRVRKAQRVSKDLLGPTDGTVQVGLPASAVGISTETELAILVLKTPTATALAVRQIVRGRRAIPVRKA